MISITKNCLKKNLGNSFATRPDLETIIAQIAAKINKKPLTCLSEDINDLQPITPSLLIKCCRIKEFYYPIDIEDIRDPSFNEKTIITKCLTRNQHLLQTLAFVLTDFISWKISVLHVKNTIKIGDIVQIHSDHPHVHRKLGRVISLIAGNNNLVHYVELVTDSGKVIRPITKFYPLEVTAKFSRPGPTISVGTIKSVPTPRCQAAKKTLALRNQFLLEYFVSHSLITLFNNATSTWFV